MAGHASTLGDLVRGLAGLRASDSATAERIARMLSVSSGAAERDGERAATTPLPLRQAPDDITLLPRDVTVTAVPPRVPEPLPTTFRLQRRRVLARPPAPGWLNDVDAMPPWPQHDPPPAAVPPLLHPTRQRALLIALAATNAPGDEIDLPALTAQLTAGQALQRIAYRLQRTLQQGLTVLLDHRLGMAPYRADQQGLLQLARGLMPDERVRVGRFQGVPGRHGGFDRVRWVGPRRSVAAAESSAPGIVLVLSDLSAGGPLDDDARASGHDWADWLQQARADRQRVRVLVPRAAARWPAACAADPALLEWSWALSLADIRRALHS